MIALLSLQSLMLTGLYQFLNTYETPDGFGTPLGYLLPVRETLRDEGDVLIDLDGQFVETARESSVWAFLLYDGPSIRLLETGITVYPEPSLAILRQTCDAEQVFRLRSAVDGSEPRCYGVNRSPSLPQTLSDLSLPSRFENGIDLFGYTWQDNCLTTYWRPQAGHGAAADLYQVAVQLVAEDGTILGNLDRPFWLTRFWRQGEPFSQQHCLTADDPRLVLLSRIRIGLYTYQDTPEGRWFFNVSLLDEQNRPSRQSVELPIRREDAAK